MEDDVELARRLKDVIEQSGFAVDHATDGDAGWYLGDTQDYDAVVLDLGLPHLPGIEVLRRWRAAGRQMPVLVLSARAAWSERVEGLNAGADDYMGKPFHAPEVVARLRALVRRAAGAPGPELRLGGIVLDAASGTARADGFEIALTARELQILSYLMHRPGRIVPQSELIDHIYAMDDVRDSNTIEVYIARLRRKLGRDAIRTIRGLGYRMG